LRRAHLPAAAYALAGAILFVTVAY